MLPTLCVTLDSTLLCLQLKRDYITAVGTCQLRVSKKGSCGKIGPEGGGELHQSGIVAYIDESGNLPDPTDRYISLAAIIAVEARSLRKVVKKASRKSKKVHLKKRGGREIKWWNAPQGVRRRVLEALVRREVEIFWLVVDKEHVGIADTPVNYGLLVCELVKECLSYHPQLQLVIDEHFSVPQQKAEFDESVVGRLGPTAKPRHMDSQQDAIIQLADFVAGAIRSRFTGKSDLADIIEGKVVVGKVIKWKQLQKKRMAENRAVLYLAKPGEPL